MLVNEQVWKMSQQQLVSSSICLSLFISLFLSSSRALQLFQLKETAVSAPLIFWLRKKKRPRNPLKEVCGENLFLLFHGQNKKSKVGHQHQHQHQRHRQHQHQHPRQHQHQRQQQQQQQKMLLCVIKPRKSLILFCVNATYEENNIYLLFNFFWWGGFDEKFYQSSFSTNLIVVKNFNDIWI